MDQASGEPSSRVLDPQTGNRALSSLTPNIATISESIPIPTHLNGEAEDKAVRPSKTPLSKISWAAPETLTAKPKPIIVKSNQPKPELLTKMGIKIRDFAYESKLAPVKPVWRQQFQPTSESSSQVQGPVGGVIARPKTPDNYITTPTMTPNGSYVWTNAEEENIAMSQQQSISQLQEIPKKLQPTSTPSRHSTQATVPPSAPTPSTPLITIATPSKLKRKLLHSGSSGSLRESRPSKIRRQRSAQELPVLRSHFGASAAAGSSRVLRSHTKGKGPAVTVEISCGTSSSGAGPSGRVLSKKAAKTPKKALPKSRSRRSKV